MTEVPGLAVIAGGGALVVVVVAGGGEVVVVVAGAAALLAAVVPIAKLPLVAPLAGEFGLLIDDPVESAVFGLLIDDPVESAVFVPEPWVPGLSCIGWPW